MEIYLFLIFLKGAFSFEQDISDFFAKIYFRDLRVIQTTYYR